MKGKLLLIDGMNLIRRIYAACERSNSSQPVEQAIQRSKQTLHRLLQQHRPSHALCVFDGQEKNWRTELLPSYKANRKPIPQPLSNALDQFQQAFWQLGVDSLLSESDEADDLIATITAKASNHLPVVIVSTDHGYGQLIGAAISQWDCFLRQYLDEQFYREKYAIQPGLLPLFVSLVGSHSHNIKGVKGVGKKTAANLLQHIQEPSDIWRDVIDDPKLAQKLRESADIIDINFRILNYKKDIPLGFSMSEIRYSGAKDA
ncbi:5'-3' exonuclease H3TH domain-containing protein [Corallincola platygyrae]|uniref:5'-3' exonuclease H3TH domain-containing protein n=1 Tax=Corallincola platygyrae TaxID=1193278 RepID=A0ABW4XQH5_9GAMM